jgi:hypothetical protein
MHGNPTAPFGNTRWSHRWNQDRSCLLHVLDCYYAEVAVLMANSFPTEYPLIANYRLAIRSSGRQFNYPVPVSPSSPAPSKPQSALPPHHSATSSCIVTDALATILDTTQTSS